MRTRPSFRVTAAALLRASNIDPVAEKEPRLKISADASGSPSLAPPAIKTLPSCNKAAEAPDLASTMFAVGAHVPLVIWAAGKP